VADNDRKISEFGNFITDKGPWDLWLTITFRKKTGLLEAKKAFKQFIKNMNSGKAFFGNFVFCFIVFEKDTRGGVHLHGVLRGVHPLYAPQIEKLCIKQFGQSKVVPYMPHRNAILYLAAKYTSPRLECYDLMKINAKARRKAPLGLSKKVSL